MTGSGKTHTIGLALGSGASRGWSHIGIIKALLREGIEPDIVCGTSVGAMIGACYLTDNLGKLEEWVLGSTRPGWYQSTSCSWPLHTGQCSLTGRWAMSIS